MANSLSKRGRGGLARRDFPQQGLRRLIVGIMLKDLVQVASSELVQSAVQDKPARREKRLALERPLVGRNGGLGRLPVMRRGLSEVSQFAAALAQFEGSIG